MRLQVEFERDAGRKRFDVMVYAKHSHPDIARPPSCSYDYPGIGGRQPSTHWCGSRYSDRDCPQCNAEGCFFGDEEELTGADMAELIGDLVAIVATRALAPDGTGAL